VPRWARVLAVVLIGVVVVGLGAAGAWYGFGRLRGSSTSHRSDVDPSLHPRVVEDPTGWKPQPKTLPPEPVASNGKPVLLQPGPEQDAYVKQLVDMIREPNPHPGKVAVFGSIESITGNQIRVRQDSADVISKSERLRGSDSKPAMGSAGQVITTATTAKTRYVTHSGSLRGLNPGAAVIVAGQRVGDGVTAELVVDKESMVRATTGPPNSPTASATSVNTVQPAARVLPVAAEVASTGSLSQADPNADLGRQRPLMQVAASPGDDSVTGSFDFKPLGVRGFNDGQEVSIGSPDGCPYLHLTLSVWLDAHAEGHFPVKFEPAGDTNFTVSSLDRPFKVNKDGDWDALSGDSKDFSFYSGWGGGVEAKVQLGCKEFGFGGVWDALDLKFDIGFRNETVQRVPLSGDQDLDVPSTNNFEHGFGVKWFDVAVALSAKITVHPALFRATLTGPGGSPQGIAMGFGPQSLEAVHQETLPNGTKDTPVHVDKFDLAPGLDVGLDLGIGVGPNAEKMGGLANWVLRKLGRARGHYFPSFSEERRPNQRGPFLEDGRWRDSHGTWHDKDGNKLSDQNVSQADIDTGYANWIHDGQDGATLTNGKWKDRSGDWHDGNRGAIKIATPPADEMKSVTTATKDGFVSGVLIHVATAKLADFISKGVDFHFSWQPIHTNIGLGYDPNALDLALGRSSQPTPQPTPSPVTPIPGPAYASAAEAAEAGTQAWARVQVGGFVFSPLDAGVVGDRAAYFQRGVRTCNPNEACPGANMWIYVAQDAAGWHYVDAEVAQNCMPAPGCQAPLQLTGCANVRQAPSTSAAVVGCLGSGTTITIDGGPSYAEGHLWWHLTGQGWMWHDLALCIYKPPPRGLLTPPPPC
jgi:hypothetical protein